MRLGANKVTATLVTMIKAAMNKYYCLVFGEYYIRFTGQFFIVKSITKAVSVEKLADNEFWFSVFAANTAHIVAALFGRMYVGHKKR